MSNSPPSIVISPIGQIDGRLCESISRKVGQVTGLATHIEPVLNNLSFAFNAERNQFHSTVILEKLAELLPPQQLKIIGITHVDLYIPILTHVYGEAQLGGSACIISISRLNEPSRRLTAKPSMADRALKEAIHELGHTFNLRHCPEHSCTMHYCRSIDDVDRKSDGFCRYCRILLEDELKRLSRSSSFQSIP